MTEQINNNKSDDGTMSDVQSSPGKEETSPPTPTSYSQGKQLLSEEEEEVEDVEKNSNNNNKYSNVGEEGWVSHPTNGLSDYEVKQSRETFGLNEIPAEITPLYMLFLQQFMGFLPFLIELAAIISLAVGDYADFGIIFGILMINAILGFREEYHAKKSLEELSKSIESEITVLRNGGEANVISTSELVPGDICLLVGGTVVPADVKWLRGDVMSMDTAALTGEPIPRKYPSKDYGDVLLAGTTVKAGECYGQVMATGTNTEIGQAQADILQDKSVRIVSVFQTKIMIVVQILITCSLLLVLSVVLVEGFVYDGFKTDKRATILDALGILISAIPVALPLVLQVNLALGAAYLAKQHHAIVTSIPALQDIASMSILCSDKTGTLTTAQMSIIPTQIHAEEGFTKNDILLYGFLSSNPDKKDDPIDRAIVKAFTESSDDDSDVNDKNKVSAYEQIELIGFNPEVKRVVSFVKNTKTGDVITIAKGLPAKIVDTEAGGKDSHELQWKVTNATNKEFRTKISELDESLSKAGYKTIAIAIANGDARADPNIAWHFVGLLPMLDPPRHDTADTIESLHQANISVKMITGDHVNVGRETARLIGLGTDIQAGEDIRNNNNTNEHTKKQLIWDADGFAAVLPSDKREVVMTLRNDYGIVVGMTGDGVNDAPALSAAQVGIAVEGATDAAKNAADLILTEPGLSPIYGAVIESRRIFARIKSYVVYRIAASLILVLTLSIIIFASGCAVDSLLVIILALLNDISMIPVAYDRASATAKPQLPNATKLVLLSLFFGLIHTAFALVLLFSLDATQGIQNNIKLENDCDSETRSFIWLYLVLVTEFMIFSARAPTFIFRGSLMPSMILIASVLLTCIGGTFIAVYGFDLSWLNVAWIWLYNIAVFLIVDICKVVFKNIIKDSPGAIIESDELIQAPEVGERTETRKHMAKQMRYVVHKEARMDNTSTGREHEVELVPTSRASILSRAANNMFQLRPVDITDGFVDRRPTRRIKQTSAGVASLQGGAASASMHF